MNEIFRRKINNNKDVGLAFLLPICILAFTFIVFSVYPFGTRNIINSDLYMQILPLMMGLKRALVGDGSLLYTFNGGLGTNFFALNTYQNASPLTWLFVTIFSEEQMVLCGTLLFILKVGLASGTMYYYLRYLTGKEEESISEKLPLMMLGSLYSLCGYVLGYYYNLMWLECIILLPLIVMGMRRAVDKQGNMLYIISLALMLFSSYYIGLMVYFFLYVYLIVYLAAEKREDIVKSFFRVRALSLVSIFLAMVVLLPTYYALTKTGSYETMGEESSRLFYYDVSTHLAQLFPGSEITILVGPANIYSGLISLVLFLSFLLNKGVSRRERIVKGLFVVFIFFVTNFRPIDVMWQLNHPPNGFPNRYSFVFAFMLIEIAAKSLNVLARLDKRKMIISLAGVTVIFGIAILGGPGMNRPFMMVIGLALLILYGFTLLIPQEDKGSIRCLLLSAVILFEVGANTVYGIGASGIVESNRFLYHKDEISELIEVARNENPYSRMEILGSDNGNAPFIYGYMGVSIFASSVPSDTFRMLNSLLKDGSGNSHSFLYNSPNPVSDAIVNLDYYISLDDELDLPWAEEVARTQNCYLYRNAYPTSFGYMVPVEMKNLDFRKSRAELLNEFVHIASGETNIIAGQEVDYNKWESAFPKVFDTLFNVTEIDGNRIAGTIMAEEKGVFLATIPFDDGWVVKVDGEEIDDFDSIKYFVSFPLEAGEHSIEMTYIPPRLKISAIISASSIFGLICVKILIYWRKTKWIRD